MNKDNDDLFVRGVSSRGKSIKRYISQKFVKNSIDFSEALYECLVEYSDGTTGTIMQGCPNLKAHFGMDSLIESIMPDTDKGGAFMYDLGVDYSKPAEQE